MAAVNGRSSAYPSAMAVVINFHDAIISTSANDHRDPFLCRLNACRTPSALSPFPEPYPAHSSLETDTRRSNPSRLGI